MSLGYIFWTWTGLGIALAVARLAEDEEPDAPAVTMMLARCALLFLASKKRRAAELCGGLT
jgi:hypothetical protein